MKIIDMWKLLVLTAVVGMCMPGCSPGTELPEKRILVFSKTEGYRHASIAEGKKTLLELGATHGFRVDTTENADFFVEDSLKHYSAIVFLNTTKDVLNHIHQADFERYIQSGGGFVGIHAAADTEYEWPWYGKLVGAYFKSHPKVQEAVVKIDDNSHPTTSHLPSAWKVTDEWYNYRNINPSLVVLASLDESSYEGGENGEKHPVVWYHEFDGGRSFYTGRGHTPESFQEPEFQQQLLSGIQYAIGENRLDYRLARSPRVPESERFVQQVYATNLNEPMEMVIFSEGKVLFVERKGAVRIYNPDTEKLTTIAQMPVHTEFEDGLLGLTKDPNFDENRWIYMFYSPQGDEWKQHVSRFDFYLENDSLDLTSEKVLIEMPTQRETCCHSGGGLEFGPDGNLFISLGDDTNPFNVKELKHNSEGFSPRNELPGRKSWDAQRSSGNANDFRGAILRIKPTPEGGYTIPEGNLFPEGTEGTKPEIYVMGCRNPFRMGIDSRRGWLYWGDVGPDANKDKKDRGPRGYDEVNQARKAGFHGWPYFVGNNYAYYPFDYKTGKIGEAPFDPMKPINTSVNNTGIQELPPAVPAFIWYPYAKSPDFPSVGTGGRNAMAGPTYYYDDYTGENRLPEYYHGKLITYDWIRGWMKAVTLDENGDFLKMEPFLDAFSFSNPVDVEMGEDGSIYVLEYGKGWFSQNPDARLSRIDYTSGNRQPIARIAMDKGVGAAPLSVDFSSDDSFDYDGDNDFSYAWDFGDGKGSSQDANPSYTFDEPGIYEVQLKITDPSGASSSSTQEIKVGNEAPTIGLNWEGNKSFFWGKESIAYSVSVSDKEDGSVEEGVNITSNYLPVGIDETLIAQGHQQNAAQLSAIQLMEGSDCAACHKMEEKSVGPAYMKVAERYDSDAKTIATIADKIMNGGSGNWGEVAMAAHPAFSQEEATSIATYLVSLDEKSPNPVLPMEGNFRADQHTSDEIGTYIFQVSYTDQGGDPVGPITSSEVLRLRPATMPATLFEDQFKGGRKRTIEGQDVLTGIENEGWLKYGAVDLSHISALKIHGGTLGDRTNGWVTTDGPFKVELRRSLNGPAIAKGELPVLQGMNDAQVAEISINDTSGEVGDLYLVFLYEGSDESARGAIAMLEFVKEGESQ